MEIRDVKRTAGFSASVLKHLRSFAGIILANFAFLHARIPYLRDIKYNFITFHYVYLISWIIIGSIVVFAGSTFHTLMPCFSLPALLHRVG